VLFGEKPTFRRNISSPSSGLKNKRSKKFFVIEDGGDTALRNMGLSLKKTALKPKRQYFS
jgi:hypothetical protein